MKYFQLLHIAQLQTSEQFKRINISCFLALTQMFLLEMVVLGLYMHHQPRYKILLLPRRGWW